MVVEVLDDDPDDHGPDTLRGIIWDAAKVGCSWYSRYPANAFWTVKQGSPNSDIIEPGLSHVRIWALNEATGYGPKLLFAGRIGDPNEAGDDVIWTAWNYLAELSLSRTGYQRYYKNKKLGSEIVQHEWNQDSGDYTNYGAKAQTHSLLAHVKTGTIQDPRNATDTFDITTDAQFGVIDVPRLLFFYDLSEMGRANTTNNVTFEITRSLDPHFNFWKNRGSHLDGRILSFPGIIRDYQYVPGVLDIRNDLATIGMKNSKAVEIVKTITAGKYGINQFGLRQDTFTIKTLAGYKNIDDLDAGQFNAQSAITQRAVREASTLTRTLRLDLRPFAFELFDGWDLEDTVRVQIERGATHINADYRIIGVRAEMDENGFRPQILVTLPSS